MMISNYSNFSGASPEPFAATKSWTLTEGNGLKTVWAKFKVGGVWTTPVFDTITLSATGPTPTLRPGAAHLTFKIKFQRIDQGRPDKTVRMTLEKNSEIVDTETVGVSSDQNGIYTGTVMNIEPGTGDILIKGWAHLQKKFKNVILSEGDNAQDWSDTELLAGDANNDNQVNILDFGVLVGEYMQTGGDLASDFDLDGGVNILDFGFIAENYLKVGDE